MPKYIILNGKVIYIKWQSNIYCVYRQPISFGDITDIQIVNTCVHNLSWSHIRRILSVSDPNARLKTHKLTHQDIGQLDMYVRMYDDLIKGSDDAPTIGVLLCTDTDNTIARYSVLHDNNQLFVAKYMTYMPTEEELRNN